MFKETNVEHLVSLLHIEVSKNISVHTLKYIEGSEDKVLKYMK